MNSGNPLHKQLEEEKFLHGVAYVRQAAAGPKILNTSELSYLNQILTDKHQDPWRLEPTAITLKSGSTHHFNVISNPVNRAREIIGEASQIAGNGQLSEAAFQLYTQMILSHLFRDANRRTAALAVLWLLIAHGASIDARALDDISLGDLRDGGESVTLDQHLKTLIQIAPK